MTNPCICGLDEVGRGPLTGPVTAACVVLDKGFPEAILKDSKQLTARKREEIFEILMEKSVWGIGWAWPEEIDELNILKASLLAMKRAYQDLAVVADEALVDGLFCPELDIPSKAFVRGDARFPCISAASIVAKVARDRWMLRWAAIEPQYGFDHHFGYPTKAHKEALRIYGPSKMQRLSFRWNSA